MPNSNSSLAPVMVIFETPLENILIMTLMPLVPFTALHYNIWCHLESFGYTAECLCTCLFQLHSSTEASEHLGRSDSKIKPGMSLEAPTFSLFKKKKKKRILFLRNCLSAKALTRRHCRLLPSHTLTHTCFCLVLQMAHPALSQSLSTLSFHSLWPYFVCAGFPEMLQEPC